MFSSKAAASWAAASAQNDDFERDLLACSVALNPSWASGAAPRPGGDVFVGAQLAAQETAIVDVARLRSHVQGCLHENSTLRNANQDLQERLNESERALAKLDAKMQEMYDIATAHLTFLFKHWNEHPEWTAADAHVALVAHVLESLQYQNSAHRALRVLNKQQNPA